MKPSEYQEVPGYSGETDIRICRRTIPQPQAEFAMDLMHHFGSIAGVQDGEDSSGRAKGRLQTPPELVQRCCDIAEAAWVEFEKRGWTLELPMPQPRKKKDEL